MDPLTGLLDGPRARSAFILRSLLSPPWSLRVQDRAPLTVVSLVRGSAWLVPDDADPIRLAPGDIAVTRGPDPYTIADHPATPPSVIVHPGQFCATPTGEPLAETMTLGVRTWGNDPEGETAMLTGTYQLAAEVSRRLLAALPPRLVLPARVWRSPLLPLVAAEISNDDPGQQVVLDRLLDLLLIGVLRAWFAQPQATAPGWYRAHADPVVGPALRLLQDRPAEPWTVASLAAATGVSRAALARRFTDLVGEPPMTFLTDWRLSLAADLLRDPSATLGSVARQVGYRTPYALSTAFKRVRGMSPQSYRSDLEGHPVIATTLGR